jgi:bifunctional DNA-binding transcriptional regulator/antitoxin component of YhaV-PrlF toxin-antitoxin module
MPRIRLTAKRQATLPNSLCDEMNLRPGDTLLVTRKNVDGEVVWCLQPDSTYPAGKWFGALRKYAKGKRHDLTSIRQSIEKARRHGRL